MGALVDEEIEAVGDGHEVALDAGAGHERDQREDEVREHRGEDGVRVLAADDHRSCGACEACASNIEEWCRHRLSGLVYSRQRAQKPSGRLTLGSACTTLAGGATPVGCWIW